MKQKRNLVSVKKAAVEEVTVEPFETRKPSNQLRRTLAAFVLIVYFRPNLKRAHDRFHTTFAVLQKMRSAFLSLRGSCAATRTLTEDERHVLVKFNPNRAQVCQRQFELVFQSTAEGKSP